MSNVRKRALPKFPAAKTSAASVCPDDEVTVNEPIEKIPSTWSAQVVHEYGLPPEVKMQLDVKGICSFNTLRRHTITQLKELGMREDHVRELLTTANVVSAYPDLVKWLDSCKPGFGYECAPKLLNFALLSRKFHLHACRHRYGRRFAAVFLNAGYEDPHDLQSVPLSPKETAEILYSAGAKKPQIYHVSKALAQLSDQHFEPHFEPIALPTESISNQSDSSNITDEFSAPSADFIGDDIHSNVIQEQSLHYDGLPLNPSPSSPCEHDSAEDTPIANADLFISPESTDEASELLADISGDDEHSIVKQGRSRSCDKLPINPTLPSHAQCDTDEPLATQNELIQLSHGRHVMLSYQWDYQKEVIKFKEIMTAAGISCWMDIDMMEDDIYNSMAEGVQGAACFICFMCQQYQDSTNCRLELQFAQNCGVAIIPVMMEDNWRASGWLGLITAGLLWTNLFNPNDFNENANRMIRDIILKFASPKSQISGQQYQMMTRSSTLLDDDSENIFTVDELRAELDRMHNTLAITIPSGTSIRDSTSQAVLPACVPEIPYGVRATDLMYDILKAVLSKPFGQVGFCGMGGIGKTTTSSWIARQDDVGKRFDIICWIPLGQTPDLQASLALLYLQVTGSTFSVDLSEPERQELVTCSLKGKNMLLVLDDGWELSHTQALQRHVDATSKSVTLVSSRLQQVVEGGDVFYLELPSLEAATTMLLLTAGYEIAPDADPPAEAIKIAQFCNRLPLMIGIAGKLIKNFGSGTGDDGVWDGALDLLKEEMAEGGIAANIESSIIRASLNSIKENRRQEATALLSAFALVPEDTVCPLGILEMVYQISAGAEKPKRIRLRMLLKMLIDRSLILGSVDRPSVHDIVRDYVISLVTPFELAEQIAKLIDLFQKSRPIGGWTDSLAPYSPECRFVVDSSPKMIEQVLHGMAPGSVQERRALAWFDDHAGGLPDAISHSCASVLGWNKAKAYAETAQANGDWQTAAIRWSSLVYLARRTQGSECTWMCAQEAADLLYQKAEKCDDPTLRDALQLLQIKAIVTLLTSWSPQYMIKYQPQLLELLATGIQACTNNLYIEIGIGITNRFLTGVVTGDQTAMMEGIFNIHNTCRKGIDNRFSVCLQEWEVQLAWALLYVMFQFGPVQDHPEYDPIEMFGEGGATLIKASKSYNYHTQHTVVTDLCTGDPAMSSLANILPMIGHFVNPKGALEILTTQLSHLRDFASDPNRSRYPQDIPWSISTWSVVCYLLKMPSGIREHCYSFGFVDYASIEPVSISYCERLPKMYRPYGDTTIGAHIMASESVILHLQAIWLLLGFERDDFAKECCSKLPRAAEWADICRTADTHDEAVRGGNFSLCIPGLLHERLGLYDKALEYLEFATRSDLKCGGSNQYHFHIIAHTARARIFARQDQYIKAIDSFNTARSIAKSKKYDGYELIVLREQVKWMVEGSEKTVSERCFQEAIHKLGIKESDLDYIQF